MTERTASGIEIAESGPGPGPVVLGLALVAVMAVVIPYVALLLGGGAGLGLTWGQLPTGSFVVLVLLSRLIGPLVVRLGDGRVDTKDATLVSYVMVLVSIGLGVGMVYYVPGLASVPFYGANVQSAWARDLAPTLPGWLLGADPARSAPASRHLFEGSPWGVGGLPWGYWAGALGGWLLMIGLLYGAGLCLTALVRRKWFEHERMAFPLAELALTVAGESSAWETRRGMFRDPLMWTVFAVPFVVWTWHGASTIFPAIPSITVFPHVDLGGAFTGAPWSALAGRLNYWFNWFVVGVAYLLPAQTSASVVLMYLFYLIQAVALTALGATGGDLEPDRLVAHEVAGAMLVFAALTVAGAWRHIRADAAAGGPEARTVRWLAGGAGAGALSLVAWGIAAGMGAGPAVACVALLLSFQLVLAKTQGILGLPDCDVSARPSRVIQAVTGVPALGIRGVTVIQLMERLGWGDTSRSFFPMILQAHRFAIVRRWRADRYLPAMLWAGLIAIASYCAVLVALAYVHGGLIMSPNWYFMGADRQAYETAHGLWSAAPPPSLAARLGMLAGMVMMLGLVAAHRRWTWWPVHPLGIVLMGGFTASAHWGGLATGLAVKSLAIRYGGVVAYRALQPAFMGLMLGDLTGRSLSPMVLSVIHALGLR